MLDKIFNVAHAETTTSAAQQAQGGTFSLIGMVVIVILFMYFVSIRPQTKRAKEHRNLLDSLSNGDEVMTSGGILGRISKLTDNYVVLALNDNVQITVQKSAIVSALPKGTLKSIA